ncbi:hypothetical protein NIES4103_62280 [Nostoc sp. NIES-4103]|nr:hypothetical protein NIES4103_62280 [Nostoc sp. NIES-4103]
MRIDFVTKVLIGDYLYVPRTLYSTLATKADMCPTLCEVNKYLCKILN